MDAGTLKSNPRIRMHRAAAGPVGADESLEVFLFRRTFARAGSPQGFAATRPVSRARRRGSGLGPATAAFIGRGCVAAGRAPRGRFLHDRCRSSSCASGQRFRRGPPGPPALTSSSPSCASIFAWRSIASASRRWTCSPSPRRGSAPSSSKPLAACSSSRCGPPGASAWRCDWISCRGACAQYRIFGDPRHQAALVSSHRAAAR